MGCKMEYIKAFVMGVIVIMMVLNVTGVEEKNEKSEEENRRQQVIKKLEKHYDNRILEFKEENRNLKNIILLGDSLTEGFDIEKYFPERRVLNRGIVADHVGTGERGILRRLDCSVFNCNPSHVYLLIGVNDLGDDNSQEAVKQISETYREICKRILNEEPEIKLYLQSCLPTGNNYARLNESIISLNEEIKIIAKDMNLEYIDLHSLMKDENGELRDDLTREGLHLKPAGYDIWRKALEPHLPPVHTDKTNLEKMTGNKTESEI